MVTESCDEWVCVCDASPILSGEAAKQPAPSSRPKHPETLMRQMLVRLPRFCEQDRELGSVTASRYGAIHGIVSDAKSVAERYHWEDGQCWSFDQQSVTQATLLRLAVKSACATRISVSASAES
jgi:hypothetical protein